MFNSVELNQYELNGSRNITITFIPAHSPTTQPTVPWSKPTEPRIAWFKPPVEPTLAWNKQTQPTLPWTAPTGSLWALNGVPMDGSAMFGGQQIGLVNWSKLAEPTIAWR